MGMCVSWHPHGISTVASSVRFKELVKRVVTVMMPKRAVRQSNYAFIYGILIIAASENHHDIMNQKR